MEHEDLIDGPKVTPPSNHFKKGAAMGLGMLVVGLIGGYVISANGLDKSVSETTIIAIVFFAFIALLTVGAMFSGAEAVSNAIKMLTSISAIFGVVIGAIPGFYFANKVNKSEIEQVQAEKNQSEEDKQKAVTAANAAGDLAGQLANVLANANTNANGKITLPSNKVFEVTNKINQIKEVTNRITQETRSEGGNPVAK